jgi:membrane protein DedA with SNARE-associated domain
VLQQLLDWIAGLPTVALYGALALAAAVENVFPPFPADTVVAFGSFAAARGKGSALGSFAATWAGNVAGALLMYALGRRYGSAMLRGRLLRAGPDAERKLHDMYRRHGLWALALSRFIPGVRAIVPPFAGALRLSPARALVAMALASGIWYGVITWFAFRVGSSWDELSARVGAAGRTVAIGATALALVAVLVWLVRRRRA